MSLDSLSQASMQGSIAILLLSIACKLFPSLSAKLRMWLWRLVFLELALGLAWITPIKLAVLPRPVEPPIPAAIVEAPDDQVVANNTPTPTLASESLNRQAPSREPATPVNPWSVAYLSGVLITTGFAVVRSACFSLKLRRATPIVDSEIADILLDLSLTAGLKSPPDLSESSEIPTATVLGVFRPTILLPPALAHSNLSEAREDLELILAHEVAHLRHRDLPWSGVVSVIHSVFFFHPLVWLAARAYRQAQESAADYAAIQMTHASPRRYAEMLLRATITTPRPFVSAAAGISVAGSRATIQQRIKDMRYFNVKPTLVRFGIASAIAAALIVLAPAYRLTQRTTAPSNSAGSTIHSKNRQPGSTHALTKVRGKANGKHKLFKQTHPSKSKAPNQKPQQKTSSVTSPATKVVYFAGLRAPIPHAADSRGRFAYDSLSAREAFRRMFETYDMSFSIAPDVKGNITLFAHGVTFDAALSNMLRQVDATYRIEGGIYEITKRQPRTFGQAAPAFTHPFPPIAMRIEVHMDGSNNLVQADINQADVRQVLRTLFKQSAIPYSISPEVQGPVTLSARNVTFNTVLENILRQANATYRIRAGVYEINHKETAAAPIQTPTRTADPPTPFR